MKKLSDYKEEYNKLSIKKNLFGNDALEAVKQSGYALKYIQTQTEAICLEAVKQNGEVLQFVQTQTEAICLEAVKQSGEALQYVQTQTEAICLEAVKQYGFALKYVSAEIFNKLENKSDMIEIDGKKISKSTISKALKNYLK